MLSFAGGIGIKFNAQNQNNLQLLADFPIVEVDLSEIEDFDFLTLTNQGYLLLFYRRITRDHLKILKYSNYKNWQ